MKDRYGFTLIEMSVALVVIALLAAGVTVGRELIETAKLRATVTQYEQFKTAANGFRLKYGVLPGDLYAAKAATFGMTPRAGTAGRGDGNQKLTACGSYENPMNLTQLECEGAMFWNDLSYAKLIPGDYSRNLDDDFSIVPGAIHLTLPAAKISGVYFTLTSEFLDTVKGIYDPYSFALVAAQGDADEPRSYGALATIPCSSVLYLDSKIDDGNTGTGKIHTKKRQKGSGAGGTIMGLPTCDNPNALVSGLSLGQ